MLKTVAYSCFYALSRLFVIRLCSDAYVDMAVNIEINTFSTFENALNQWFNNVIYILFITLFFKKKAIKRRCFIRVNIIIIYKQASGCSYFADSV